MGVSNPQRIATNKKSEMRINVNGYHVSNPQRIATNEKPQLSWYFRKFCFKPSKDRYKPYCFLKFKFSTESFKPSKDRYKPEEFSEDLKEFLRFQTLKGSLQTRFPSSVTVTLNLGFKPSKDRYKHSSFTIYSTVYNVFQTLKGSLQTSFFVIQKA